MNQENGKAGKILGYSETTNQIIAAAIRVHREIVVELKAITQLESIHFAIGRSYLKAMALQDDLLFNFATAPLAIKRFCRERTETESVDLLK
jgi:GxxExxY protein